MFYKKQRKKLEKSSSNIENKHCYVFRVIHLALVETNMLDQAPKFSLKSALLVTSLILFAPTSTFSKKRFTWPEFRQLSSKSVRGTWLNSTSYIYKSDDTLRIYESKSKSDQIYYQNDDLSGANDWSLSGSGQHVLIARERNNGYAQRFKLWTSKEIWIKKELLWNRFVNKRCVLFRLITGSLGLFFWKKNGVFEKNYGF